MPKAGDVLRQGDTDTMRFRKVSADTDGAYLEVEANYASMKDVRPPVHQHPGQDELFQVQEGALTFEIDGKEKVVSAGQELALPKGNWHSVWNADDEPARFIWRTTPALKTEYMYELLWNLVEDGKMGRHGQPRPSLLQSMVMMYSYRNEYQLKSPPRGLFIPLAACLSVPGRLLGYSDRHQKATTP